MQQYTLEVVNTYGELPIMDVVLAATPDIAFDTALARYGHAETITVYCKRWLDALGKGIVLSRRPS